MPPLGARLLAAPSIGPGGNQGRFAFCVEATDLAGAAAALDDTLRDAGWRVTARPPPAGAGLARHGLAAEKDDLRLAITVQATPRTGCDTSLGQFFAAASLHRLAGDQLPSPE
jgi:hypothetical protein